MGWIGRRTKNCKRKRQASNDRHSHNIMQSEQTYQPKLDLFQRSGSQENPTSTRQWSKEGVLADAATEKTTLVLMGHSRHRLPQYDMLLPHYATMTPWLDRVLLVWCNPHVPPPAVPANTSVPVLLQRRSESLNEHFNVSSLVRTSSVLLVHDDLMVLAPMIQKLINVHKAEPNRIVGLDQRCFNSRTGQYLGSCFNSATGDYLPPCFRSRRGVEQPPCFNTTLGQYLPLGSAHPIALTRTAILSSRYLQLYMNDEALLSFVDGKYNGGEDIAINFLVHQASGQWAKTLEGAGGRVELPSPDGLSNTVSKRDPTDTRWESQRSRCVSWHIQHFNYRD